MHKNIEFSNKLFYGENGFGPIVKRLDTSVIKKNIGKMLSVIFKDIKSFKINNKDFNVEQNFGGKFKFLGEIFSKQFDENNSKECGILNFFDGPYVLTVLGFSVYFYDDKFIASVGRDCYNPIKELMLSKYQHRYIKEMHKMFGDKYIEHYKQLVLEKKKLLDEEYEFVKDVYQ